jgi:hypothetical protein
MPTAAQARLTLKKFPRPWLRMAISGDMAIHTPRTGTPPSAIADLTVSTPMGERKPDGALEGIYSRVTHLVATKDLELRCTPLFA